MEKIKKYGGGGALNETGPTDSDRGWQSSGLYFSPKRYVP